MGKIQDDMEEHGMLVLNPAAPVRAHALASRNAIKCYAIEIAKKSPGLSKELHLWIDSLRGYERNKP